jgi:hypothetical protein
MNGHGELGAGYAGHAAYAPVAVKVGAVEQAVSAYFDSFFLLPGGTVEAVGGDQIGLLGIGRIQEAPRLQPTPILRGVSQLAASIALKGGVPWVWGAGVWGELADGREGKGHVALSPEPVALHGIVKVASGGADRYAISSSGELFGWGENRDGQLRPNAGSGTVTVTRPVELAEHVLDVAGGGVSSLGGHTLILHADETVSCRGDDSHFECGNPVLHEVVEVSAGLGLSLARKRDGSAWWWGTLAGQRSQTPERVPLPGPAEQVSAGFRYALFLVAGRVYGEGYDGEGELGDGQKTTKTTPTLVASLAGVDGIAAGEYHSLAWGSGVRSPARAIRPGQPISSRAHDHHHRLAVGARGHRRVLHSHAPRRPARRGAR